ncbi:spore germination protein KA [Anaerobacterium chartisolvens]|uniref:Spore germination protein KA n=1 Tax=Anaerobacterium chartisolvens TaxID=1297424 RepID=A0A369BMR9_9FIRM|nr:spore germination protein [Anaerobacterium chartisolvens]RCX20974.1 spore germination protein KA [Anaerobacterium chartisolvens]
MFRYILRKVAFLSTCGKNSNEKYKYKEVEENRLCTDIDQNLEALKNILGSSNDIITREFVFAGEGRVKGLLVFIEDLVDNKIINESIIKPLISGTPLIYKKENADNVNVVKSEMLSVGDVKQENSMDEIVYSCLSGDTVLLIDGSAEALIIASQGGENRGVEESKTESVVRGPRESFSEDLRTNTSLLRRKIKNPDLTLEKMKIGRRTGTMVCISYIKNLAAPELIEEVRRRLKAIDTDAILESGYIEQFIEDAPFSIFPTVSHSEKPDVIAAKILEGRAAIMIDRTPFALTVPMLFIEDFQSPEDYYSRPYFSSFIRIIRFLSFLISILAPATYVALTTFHQELIPTNLLLTMAAAREGTPFPSVLEAGIMVITFEILKEAGIRLPRPVGQAISIVGALVVGESAVSAGLIGAPMVIVVAITAVSSFVVPFQSDTGSILRIILLGLAGFMGAVGIMMGLLVLIVHLASLRSFGAPYFSPLAPHNASGMKDTAIRAPIWLMDTRPSSIDRDKRRRQAAHSKPEPPKKQ